MNVLAGAVVSVVIVLVCFLLSRKDQEIQPAEVTSWSWMRARKNISSSLITGLLLAGSIGLIGGLFAWFFTGLGSGIPVIVLFGLLSSLIIGVLSGFSSERLDERLFVRPNEGIHRSTFFAARNGLLAGLLSGLVLTAVDMFVTRFLSDFPVKSDFLFFSTLAFVLTITLGMSMHKGGEACVKHVLLRFMLWSGGQIPWNYPRFLDDAAECLLLRKVGGGYIFIHHVLLDYFASLTPTEDAIRLLQR